MPALTSRLNPPPTMPALTSHSPLGDLLARLPSHAPQHARTTATYAELAATAAALVSSSGFAQSGDQPEDLGDLGTLVFPYTSMGAVDTLDLFGLDELIIFSFYRANRHRYRRSADIGANLGLHSLLMARCGWDVTAYEPDPRHTRLLQENLRRNRCDNVTLREAAVSDRPGTLEFVRVVGNTTSSHLAGAKSNAYGELVRFPVQVESIADIMPRVDFVKMDAEGQEKIIILGTTVEHWRKTDMMVEVGTAENAAAIYAHLRQLGLNAFAQKSGWQQVRQEADMPASYRDGSLFITIGSTMPWH